MQNIEEIYKQHSNTVYKYLFCLTHSEDTSEELTQETFAIAVKEINKFKGNCKISVWLCQIAKHLWYKKLKKEKRQNIVSFDEANIELVEEKTPVEYATINKNEKIILDHENKIATIETGEFTELTNKEKSIKNTQFGQDFSLIHKITKAFISKIHTSYRDVGREYYVLNYIIDDGPIYEEWIDKETGLPLKLSGNGSIKTFFEGTDVVKEEIDMSSRYRYEFNTVTEEDVNIPDYSEYKVEQKNTDYNEFQ